jgi:hypothetical protein
MHRPFGDMPGSVFVGVAATGTFVHGWGLAKATGRNSDLDPQLAAGLLAGIRPAIPDAIRGVDGQAPFGPARAAHSARRTLGAFSAAPSERLDRRGSIEVPRTSRTPQEHSSVHSFRSRLRWVVVGSSWPRSPLAATSGCLRAAGTAASHL